MKKITTILFCTLLWFNTVAQVIVPEHKTDSYVNDFANVIDDSKEAIIDKKIRDFKAKSSIEITVVSINSLDGSDIDSYSNTLFRKWGIGTKELNNGLLILFSVSDRKWRIEVGTGLEEYMTDGYAKIEAKNVLVPYFKSKDYFAGVNALVDDFIAKLGPTAWDERAALKKKQAQEALQKEAEFADGLITFFTWFSVLAVLGVIVAIAIRKKIKEKRRIEAEAAERKRRVEALVLDNNQAMNEFTRMTTWAKAHKDLFLTGHYSKKINFDDYDNARKKLDDLLTQRNLVIESLESEKILIRNITQELISQIKVAFDRFNEFTSLKSSILEAREQVKRYEKEIKTTETYHTRMVATFGISIVEIAFPQKSLSTKISEVDSVLYTLSMQQLMENYPSMKKEFEQTHKVFRETSTAIEIVKKKLDSISNAIQYISNNRGKINSLLHDAQRKVKERDVEHSTKSKFNTVKAKAEMFSENTNPLIAYNDMSTLINDLNSVITSANSDISEAERKRRRKEEEDDRRRAAAIISSSYSSSSSSSSDSSSSSSSDFGGGSSSGGGASGDW